MQALWMLATALLFAAMAVCVKIASAWFNAAELVLYCGLLGIGLPGRRRAAELESSTP